MLQALLFLVFAAALLAVPLVVARLASVPSEPRPARSPRRAAAPATRPRGDLAPLAWPEGDALPVPRPLAPADRRARMRDRYVAARFHGIATCAADLRNAARVIRGARLLFEEGAGDRAHELLALAIGEQPDEAAVRLAAIEIAYLQRDTERFLGLAASFRESHPAHPEWPDVARLGHALDPAHAAFRDGASEFAHPHYGPWPDTPNWIQASWDLTADVLAAEFHHAMTQAEPARRAASR